MGNKTKKRKCDNAQISGDDQFWFAFSFFPSYAPSENLLSLWFASFFCVFWCCFVRAILNAFVLKCSLFANGWAVIGARQLQVAIMPVS